MNENEQQQRLMKIYRRLVKLEMEVQTLIRLIEEIKDDLKW